LFRRTPIDPRHHHTDGRQFTELDWRQRRRACLSARTNRHSPDAEHGRGDVDEGEVVVRQSVEPGGEAAEVRELVEASLDAIA
jgi:hypothetical protein